MRGNSRSARLALAWALAGWMSLPAYAQLPVPHTEASPANPALPANSSPLQSTTTSAVLPLEQAFQLATLFEGDNTLLLFWTIAPGHYLYRDQFQFLDANGQPLPANLPTATNLTDEYFGETSVYFGSLQLRFPLAGLPQTPAGEYLIQLRYQGCAKDRYCYPPAQREIRLALPH